MRPFALIPLSTLLAGVLPAQFVKPHIYIPATRQPVRRELNSASSTPFMRPLSRLQAFYSATETTAKSFRAYDLALRFDGPRGKGPIRLHRISELEIAIGTTSVARPTASFDANLSQPLTIVFKGRVSFPSDHQQVPGPQGFGAPGRPLHFPFSRIVNIAIPKNGWFVVQMKGGSNTNLRPDPAYIDAFLGGGGPSGGTSRGSGKGCPASPNTRPASIYTVGQYAPGTAHSIFGYNLGSGAPVATWIGSSDRRWGPIPLPLNLGPLGMPGCTLYTSLDLQMLRLADANGKLSYRNASSWFYVPLLPGLAGARLYEQHISLVRGANAAGIITSNKRTVTLGAYKPPTHGVFLATHGWDSGAATATWIGVMGIAMKILVI